jgi:hypothetical protein
MPIPYRPTEAAANANSSNCDCPTTAKCPAALTDQTRLDLPGAPVEFNAARDFLMLVKTYPTPSTKYGETVCCAAIDPTGGGWVRIYPVNFRSLNRDVQFKKWQFINATYSTARNDNRPESIRIQQETIKPGEWLPPSNWARRRTFTDPLVVPSIEWLRRENASKRTSLGIIRPLKIEALLIEAADRWDPESEDARAQLEIQWEKNELPKTDLEPIPFRFRYRFRCDDSDCNKPHEMVILDWEIAEAYRKWRHSYPGEGWREALRTKYLEELPSRDLHLIVGTHHRYGDWMIVGVFAVPRPKMPEHDRRTRSHLVGQESTMTGPWVDLEAKERDRLPGSQPDRLF